ncbi:Flocculation suppression protein [Thecaphora frezii]
MAASPTSSSATASANAAVPRDFQASMSSRLGRSVSGPDSPTRKRPRSDLLAGAPQPGHPALPSMALLCGDRQDEGGIVNSSAGPSRDAAIKRQKSASPPSRAYDRDSEAASRSARPGPPLWHSRSDRGPSFGRHAGMDPLSHHGASPRPSEAGEPAFGRAGAGAEADVGARDSRGIAGLVGGRSFEADRPPPGFGTHPRPQSEVPEAVRGFRRGPLPMPSSSSSAASLGGDKHTATFTPRRQTPPPRLPGFASLDNETLPQRPRDDGFPMMGGNAGGFPGSGPSSPRRMMPYRPQGHPHYPPHPPGSQSRTPILSHASPSASSSYGNPPMIHPSLAGLPGAGGGQGGKQQPSFVSKLYSMLEDPSIEDMITWGPSGTVFSVANPAEFSRLVLPNWFKHSNWQSFVRQLNMYGFHKVNHSYQGNPTDEIQVWEFRHPNFRRGEIGLLNDIKRKSSRQKRTGSPSRSLAGTDLRADRSGGSSTPSPEVPLAAIPGGGSEMGCMASAMFRQGPEHGMNDPRMEARAYELASSDPRGLRMEDGPFLPMGDPRFRRPKSELLAAGGSGGGGGSSNNYSAAGAGFLEDRMFIEPQMDRNELMARFEDLSERSDAIIRHASFLENQVRTLSEQLNESRAYTQHCVREEMTILLERLARSLASPNQGGADPAQAMLSVIQSHLAALQAPRERESRPNDPNRARQAMAAPSATTASPPQSHAFASKRPSV